MKKSRGLGRSAIEATPIILRNEDDVIAFDENCTVPRHIDGRQKKDSESWILGRYLRAQAAAGSLRYPFTVTRAEESASPDFMLRIPGVAQIGIEVTEASTPEAHRLFIKSEQAEGKPVSRDNGVVGDAAEREWASVVSERIQVKAAGLAGGHWAPADGYVLVLYENAPTSVAVDLPKALSNLHAILAPLPRSCFSNISIIAVSASRLISLVSNTRILPIPPKGGPLEHGLSTRTD
jgi:hypothetical protein